MEIKLENKKVVEIKSGGSVLWINYDLKKEPKLEGISIIVDTKGLIQKTDNTYLITNPGEYESGDIYVQLQKLEAGYLVLVSAEDIEVCFVDGDVLDISKNMLDQMAAVNILIAEIDSRVNGDTKSKLLWNTVNEIEPNILIPVTRTESEIDDFKKQFEQSNPETLKKLKVKAEDFNVEDIVTGVVILDPLGVN